VHVGGRGSGTNLITPGAAVKSVTYASEDNEELLERDELLDLAERLIADHANGAEWEQKSAEGWAYFLNRAQHRPSQGWKLHVSATVRSAGSVLAAAMPVLLRNACSFKMLRSKKVLGLLNEAHSPRSAAGKFITVYPSSAEEAVRIAEECHQATEGLNGPVILSDRPYRPGSLVHYRYGSFIHQTVYDAQGKIVHVIHDPQGRPIRDARDAWFSPPSWVEDPFRQNAENREEPAPATILLDRRYAVSQALRHANKGGVYLATDQETGEVVVIKEARPHVGEDRFGRDVTDQLRVEAANLERLDGLGVAPKPLRLFSAGGHLFLVLEKLPGMNLRRFRRQREKEGPLPEGELLDLARSITALLQTCHDAGVLIRDFTPNNLFILPDGSPRTIDLEFACPEGEILPTGVGAYTPGYASPQQKGREVPQRSDDYFSLAATLFFLATSRDPYLLEDRPPARSHRERLSEQLKDMIRSGLIPRIMEAPILGGMAEDPEERWSPARVLSHLSAAGESARREQEPPAGSSRAWSQSGGGKRDEQWAKVARDLAAHAVASIDTGNKQQPVESSCAGQLLDPCCVQYGAAGVGVFLLSALPLEDAGRGTVARLGAWVADSLRSPRGRPAGLYFGAAGAAWFLLDASEASGDADLRERACELVLALRPNPRQVDVTHGASGIGMTLLRFHHVTGRGEFLEAAARLADHVISAAADHSVGTVWPQPDEAGKEAIFYGFAHGNAGIAYFLLAMYAATGEVRYLAASEAAAETLIRVAQVEEGRAYWDHGPERPSRWTYWCNGSSGVGTTMLRLYQVTGNEQYRRLAEMAGHSVYHSRWFSGLGQCHGLAGNGEFLLDLHQVLGDNRYLAMAGELAEVLFSYRVLRDGRTVFPDDSLLGVAPDFGVGTSGVGAFFNRLAGGGARLFMVDELLDVHRERMEQAVLADPAGVR
jgi:hypothetical protein